VFHFEGVKMTHIRCIPTGPSLTKALSVLVTMLIISLMVGCATTGDLQYSPAPNPGTSEIERRLKSENFVLVMGIRSDPGPKISSRGNYIGLLVLTERSLMFLSTGKQVDWSAALWESLLFIGDYVEVHNVLQLDNLAEVTKEGTWAYSLTDIQTCEVDPGSIIMLAFLRVDMLDSNGKNYVHVLYHKTLSKEDLHLLRDKIRKTIQGVSLK